MFLCWVYTVSDHLCPTRRGRKDFTFFLHCEFQPSPSFNFLPVIYIYFKTFSSPHFMKSLLKSYVGIPEERLKINIPAFLPLKFPWLGSQNEDNLSRIVLALHKFLKLICWYLYTSNFVFLWGKNMPDTGGKIQYHTNQTFHSLMMSLFEYKLF